MKSVGNGLAQMGGSEPGSAEAELVFMWHWLLSWASRVRESTPSLRDPSQDHEVEEEVVVEEKEEKDYDEAEDL